MTGQVFLKKILLAAFAFFISELGAKHDVFESTKDARPGPTPAAATRSQ